MNEQHTNIVSMLYKSKRQKIGRLPLILLYPKDGKKNKMRNSKRKREINLSLKKYNRRIPLKIFNKLIKKSKNIPLSHKLNGFYWSYLPIIDKLFPQLQ